MKKKVFQLKSLILLPLLTLVLYSCEKDIDNSPVTEKEFDHTNFNKVMAGDVFNVIITEGADFSIRARGPVNSVNEMKLTVSANQLRIEYTVHRNNRPQIDVFITMPVLTSINLSGASKGSVSGFAGSPFNIRAILSGASELDLDGAGVNTEVDISGASKLTVNGTTESLYGVISGAGRLNSYALTSTEVDLTLSGGSTAYVNVVESIIISASGGSKVYYKGNPPTKHFETSGGSEVIPQ